MIFVVLLAQWLLSRPFLGPGLKVDTPPTTWPSFTSIGRRSSEISRWKKRKEKKTSAVKRKTAGN